MAVLVKTAVLEKTRSARAELDTDSALVRTAADSAGSTVNPKLSDEE